MSPSDKELGGYICKTISHILIPNLLIQNKVPYAAHQWEFKKASIN